MCGIAGAAGPGVGRQTSVVEAMTAALTHRGPDSDGFHVATDVVLGMRRLSIIDVEGGDQPIYNEDGSIAVVFNGEIYNFAELRGSLEARGHCFSSNSDTECIVHLYEEYGPSCVQHLRGMFAFALWDDARRRLMLARDRVGKKPLYYRLDRSTLWFGSELKALLATPFQRQVDPIALHHYLTYQYVPAPWSIVEGVRKLPPAHTLLFERGSIRLERYWRLTYQPKLAVREVDVLDLLREHIREAVRVRMIAERPIGAFLSGGVDSSLIVAMMAELASGPVKTFSIGFDEPAYDERAYARIVAEEYGTNHHEFVVRPSALDIVDDLTTFYDEPFADSSSIPTFILSRLTRQHVVVALNGDGGDESFAGYERYVADALAKKMRLGTPVRGAGTRVASALPATASPRSTVGRARRFLLTALADPEERYAQLMCHFSNEQKADLYTNEMQHATTGTDSYRLITDVFSDTDGSDVDRLLDVDVNTYLPGDLLTKVDIASMAHSLEARSPFLDHHVMEFAASLPADMKLRWSRGRWDMKHVLKQASRGLLPAEVIDRDKMGFGVPMASWLRGELRDLTYDTLCDHTARSRGYFRPEAVTRLLLEHEAGVNHSNRIWNLLQFELWHRRYMDRGRQPI
jgi:asparagine synthase (glutamine-hydrolysing)